MITPEDEIGDGIELIEGQGEDRCSAAVCVVVSATWSGVNSSPCASSSCGTVGDGVVVADVGGSGETGVVDDMDGREEFSDSRGVGES